MPSPLTLWQHRVRSLSTLFVAAALVVPAAVGAQSPTADDAAADDAAADAVVARQVRGSSTHERLAGRKADCRPFTNEALYKRTAKPGKGVVKRDFGAGNGDKGDLVFTDAETGTALFWTAGGGYLSVSMVALAGDPGDAELVGLLSEGAPRSLARKSLLDELADQAATADVTQEQLLETFADRVGAVDGGCLWSSRFVPRKSDRDQLVPFWDAMVGMSATDPSSAQDGRFDLELAWQDPSGNEQKVVQAVDAISSDGRELGHLFEADGWELLVKVLDACSSNDHFWVFAASATDVQFALTVTDTVSSQTKTYTDPLAEVPAITDTTAFATCP